MTKTQFRAAAWLSMLIAISGLVASFVGESRLPLPLQQYLEQRRNADFSRMDWVLLVIGLPLIVGGVTSFVGMLRFMPWSRPLWIGVSAVSVLTLPLLGPTVEPSLVTALLHMSSMGSAALVAVAYCSPTVSKWFESPQPNAPLQPTSGVQARIG